MTGGPGTGVTPEPQQGGPNDSNVPINSVKAWSPSSIRGTCTPKQILLTTLRRQNYSQVVLFKNTYGLRLRTYGPMAY